MQYKHREEKLTASITPPAPDLVLSSRAHKRQREDHPTHTTNCEQIIIIICEVVATATTSNSSGKKKEMNMAHNNNKYIVSVVKVGLNTIGIRNEKGKEREKCR